MRRSRIIVSRRTHASIFSITRVFEVMAEVDIPRAVMTSETELSEPLHSSMEPTSQALTKPSSKASLEQPSKKTKVIRRKRRPARPQVDPSTIKSEPPPQTGTIFNIWYNKWSGGDREDAYLSKTPAPSRCNISRDSGYTRADKTPGS